MEYPLLGLPYNNFHKNYKIDCNKKNKGLPIFFIVKIVSSSSILMRTNEVALAIAPTYLLLALGIF